MSSFRDSTVHVYIVHNVYCQLCFLCKYWHLCGFIVHVFPWLLLQCIPTPLAWYAHHLPSWILKLGVVSTYWIEAAAPVLFFLPIRSLRLMGFLSQVLLQLLIIATGNYNFFNLLTITLSFSLVDDQFLGYGKKFLITEFLCLLIIIMYECDTIQIKKKLWTSWQVPTDVLALRNSHGNLFSSKLQCEEVKFCLYPYYNICTQKVIYTVPEGIFVYFVKINYRLSRFNITATVKFPEGI